MRFDVVTLFPQMCRVLTEGGVVGRAIERGTLELSLWNPRDYATDKHRTVDDRPYGGGPGMVMKYEPLAATLTAMDNADQKCHLVCLSPQGRPLNQQRVRELAQYSRIGLIAGRYEAIDERIIDEFVDEEISIGDYVLSGGELAAMVVVDAVARLVPGVLGDDESALQDSFSAGLLDCPHYTRPDVIAGRTVPPVLMGGDHKAISRWRLKQSLGRTWQRRPDVLAVRGMTAEEQALLEEFKREQS